ncbi:S ribonuclease [Pyrus ussuriensis x Pyrus communis]|uniref:S ribonuclease n=1 Tax=Pyrus ussuriensis x Pyrus communis TaxID=2448454 RepID=A0A5N5GL96_9ROSA|nr:S ribonuclease [Pyrus ussuriensis x Pyrus communis]
MDQFHRLFVLKTRVRMILNLYKGSVISTLKISFYLNFVKNLFVVEMQLGSYCSGNNSVQVVAVHLRRLRCLLPMGALLHWKCSNVSQNFFKNSQSTSVYLSFVVAFLAAMDIMAEQFPGAFSGSQKQNHEGMVSPKRTISCYGGGAGPGSGPARTEIVYIFFHIFHTCIKKSQKKNIQRSSNGTEIFNGYKRKITI